MPGLAADVDVLVAGLGPTGQAVTALLAAEGVDVLAVDAAAGPHAEPRAAALDDGALRILQALGVALPRLEDPEVVLVGADGREIPVPGPVGRPQGHPPLALFHQPDLEEALLARAGESARFGWRAEGVARDEAGVTVLVRRGGAGGGDEGGGAARAPATADTPGPGVRAVRARWLLACDGARSTVRAACGIGFPGRSDERRWLVVDAEVPRPLDPRPRVRFVGDPRRAGVSLPLSPRHHRWELALAPGDDGAAFALPPGTRELRRATYVHSARRATAWRAGRVLLLGDAAHVMPPFAGQGLSHGLRDAANVAWKLAAVLRGEAPPALLDSHERERRAAVAAATRLALVWGALVQLRRRRLARARDGLMRAAPALVVRTRAAPSLRAGAFDSAPPGGRVLPQPAGDDDRLGAGWALVARRGDPRAAMTAADRALWGRVGARVVAAGPQLDAWLARHRVDVVAVRPDRVVLAGARRGEESRLAAAYRSRIGAPEKGQGAERRTLRRSATNHP